MSSECKICNGSKAEPGFDSCAFCDNTGKAGGLDLKGFCGCNQGRLPCTCKGVTRYNTVQLRFATGALAKAQFVNAVALDAAQSELAALREELARKDKVIQAFHDGYGYQQMQQRLAAAEQRNAELTGLLRDARWRITNKNTSTEDYKRLDKPVVERIDTALKQTESEQANENPERSKDW